MQAYSIDRTHVAVCVPARNEAELLPGLLRSLAAQCVVCKDCALKVVVVANNCTDDTTQVIRNIARAERTRLDLRLIEVDLPTEDAHVGNGRRLAMDAAADWLEASGMVDGVIMTTDADAIAPPDWVANNLAALATAEAVGGRLVVAQDPMGSPALAAMHCRIEAYWAAVRALEDAIDPPPEDPSPRHGDHTAASLALHASMYRRVGGLPPLRSGEDNALVAAIRATGGRIRHAPDVSITVSARETGRADGGMAPEMKRRGVILAAGSIYEVPVASHWRSSLQSRGRLRAAWHDADGVPLSSMPKPFRDLDRRAFPNVIAFLHHCETLLDRTVESEPLEQAIAMLEVYRRDAIQRHAAE